MRQFIPHIFLCLEPDKSIQAWSFIKIELYHLFQVLNLEKTTYETVISMNISALRRACFNALNCSKNLNQKKYCPENTMTAR